MTILQQAGAVARSAEIQRGATSYLNLGIALALCQGDPNEARQMVRDRFWRSIPIDHIKLFEPNRKAAVPAATTTDSSWAGPLAEMKPLSTAFVEYLRPMTVLGRLDGVRPVPFNTKFPRATAGSTARWAGEGRAVAATKMAFDTLQFPFSKIGSLSVFSAELAKVSSPPIEAMLRLDIAAAIAAALDVALLDPAAAAVPGVSPASITNGATNIPSSGSTLAALNTDMAALFAAVTTNLVAPYLITTPTVAVKVAALMSGAGSPTVGGRGGEFWGVPVIASANCPAGLIVLVDAAELMVADDGVMFKVAHHATIQMDDAPANPATASTVMTSLWQMNLVGLMAERVIHWAMRRDDAVAYISGVA